MRHKFYLSAPGIDRRPTHTNTQKCENLLANPRSQNNGRKTYVLDTSVLLADPVALARLAEHEVIIPITVIGELETKRDHPELGYFAREALRTQVAELAVKGAEQILRKEVNASVHADLLSRLKTEL